MVEAQTNPTPPAMQQGAGVGDNHAAVSAVQHPPAIRVAYRGHKKHFFLSHLAIRREDAPGDMVMRLLLLAWQAFLADRFFWTALHVVLYKPVLEIGTLSTFRNIDIEAMRILEVVVSNRVLSEELTEAFLRPALLRDNGPFTHAYPDVMTASTTRRVVVVSFKARKRGIVYLVGLAALAAVVIGIAVGLVSGKPEVGFACSGGIAAVLGLFLMACFWILR